MGTGIASYRLLAARREKEKRKGTTTTTTTTPAAAAAAKCRDSAVIILTPRSKQAGRQLDRQEMCLTSKTSSRALEIFFSLSSSLTLSNLYLKNYPNV